MATIVRTKFHMEQTILIFLLDLLKKSRKNPVYPKYCILKIFSNHKIHLLKKKISLDKIDLKKDESNHKPDKIWLDKGSQLYNRPMKS